MSKTPKALFSALLRAQGKMGGLVPDSTNPHLKNKYASLAAVLDVVQGPLREAGIVLYQSATLADNAVVVMSALIHPESGEQIQEQLPIPVANLTAQAIGGAITYGRRYLAMAMCGLAPDDDDDGNAVSQGQAAQRKPQSQRPQAPAPTHRNQPQTTPEPPPNDLPTSLDDLPELAPAQAAEENPFHGDAPPAKVGQLTEAQRNTIHALGMALYGNKATWDAKRPGIVRVMSGKRTESSKELWQAEATQLIAELEKRVIAEAKRIAKPLVDSGQIATVDEIDQSYGVELAQSAMSLRKVIEQVADPNRPDIRKLEAAQVTGWGDLV